MSAVWKLVSSVAAAVLTLGVTTAALAVDALPDARFVVFVQQANDFELDSSRLALQRSESAAIRAYAKRLLTERGEIAGLNRGKQGFCGVVHCGQFSHGINQSTIVRPGTLA